MALSYGKVSRAKSQAPPIVAELEAIFAELPDDELLSKLKGPMRRGRPGYDVRVLWHCYVAYYALGLESVSALIRLLYDNPYVARACGINSPDEIPSQPTFSRFGSKLAKFSTFLAVKNVHRKMVRRMFTELPDFGKSVAIDSTDIKAWSHGGKKGKNGKPTDPDAGWAVKKNTEGRTKYVWGYKAHILCDTQYELPIAVDITAGDVHDVNKATPLLAQARFTYSRFLPKYVIGDKGYSSDKLRRSVRRHYHAMPIIDANPSHKRAANRQGQDAAFKMILNRRSAIERLNARLKTHHKLNFVRVRGKAKVRLHITLSAICLQAKALATNSRASVRRVA